MVSALFIFLRISWHFCLLSSCYVFSYNRTIRIYTIPFVREKNLRRTLVRIIVELYALWKSRCSSKICNSASDHDNNFTCNATNLPFSAEPYTVSIINFDIPKRIMNDTNTAMLMNWIETQPVANIFPLLSGWNSVFFFFLNYKYIQSAK